MGHEVGMEKRRYTQGRATRVSDLKSADNVSHIIRATRKPKMQRSLKAGPQRTANAQTPRHHCKAREKGMALTLREARICLSSR